VNLNEIYDVLEKQGLANKFGDDMDAEHAWLYRALRHALAMLDIAQVYVRERQKEWLELES